MRGKRGGARLAALSPARLMAIAALVLALVACTAPAAHGLVKKEDPALLMTGQTDIALSRVDVVELPVQTTPGSIVTGIPCGMLEMCGQDPCLCGAVDEWGACACNGRETTYPTFALTCDTEGVVGLVQAFGRTYLVALGTGATDAVVTAELAHHEPATLDVHVEVAPFAPLDALKLAGALVALVVAVALVALLVRLAVLGARRVWRRVRGAQAARAGRPARRLRGLDGGDRHNAPAGAGAPPDAAPDAAVPSANEAFGAVSSAHEPVDAAAYSAYESLDAVPSAENGNAGAGPRS